VENPVLKVIVTGVGGGVGQSILRALRLSQLDLQVIGLDIDPWSAGLYRCHKGYLVPPASDPNYIEVLLNICEQEKADALIPGSDPELPVLAPAKELLEKTGTKVIISSEDAIRICRDKLAAYRFFRERNLPYVPTAEANEATALAREVGFPLVVKPAGGSGSKGVTVVFNEEELEKALVEGEIIAQEYLIPVTWGKAKSQITTEDVVNDGLLTQTDEISIQVLAGWGRENLGCFTSKNVLKYGVPVLIEPLKDLATEKVALQMVGFLVDEGLIGPCNLQCKITRSGPLFFEINPRFTGITAVRAALGFNEVEAILKNVCLGESAKKVRQKLKFDDRYLCSRFVTEMIFTQEEFERLKKTGRIKGQGRTTEL